MCALFAQSKNSFRIGANDGEVAPAAQVQSFANGDGTESNPYQIASFEELQLLATNCNAGETYSGKYFKVMKHITIDNTKSTTNWVPIAVGKTNSVDNVFSGNFDGNNKEIIVIGGFSYTFSYSGYSSYGTIIANASDATVKNLHIVFQTNGAKTFTFKKDNSSIYTGYLRIGGIVGSLNGGTVENCSISGDRITFSGVNSDYRFGGIMCLSTTCGDKYKETILKDCKVFCDVEGSFYRAGGIVAGYVSSITDCCVKSNLAFSDGQSFGGIAGSDVEVIEKCCISGNLTFKAYDYIGGIIGKADFFSGANSTIKNCIVNGTIDFYSSGDPGYVGILVGRCGTITNCIANVIVTRLTASGGCVGAIGGQSVTAYNCLVIGTASYSLTSSTSATSDTTNGLYSVVSDSNLKLVNTFKATGTNGYTWKNTYPWDIGENNSIWCIENSNATCPTLTNFSLDKLIVKITVSKNNKNNATCNDIIYLLDDNNDILRQCVVNDKSVIELKFAYNSNFKILVYKTLYMNCIIDDTLTNTKAIQGLSRDMNIEINITSVVNINNWTMI